jgi:hypothetical protein
MASKAALWQAQEREYPGSIRVTPAHMIEWAESANTCTLKYSRYRRLGMSIQYSNVVFYFLPVCDEYGYRHGTDGSEYVVLGSWYKDRE